MIRHMTVWNLRRSVNVAGVSNFMLPLAIGLATGLDYFDNALFSFFLGHMAGGVNAAPDELIWSSSAYAVASVIGILGQQWWVDCVGYRRYLTASLLLFSAGAIGSALSSNSLEFAAARALQGYAIGPMMGACRIFLRTQLAPSEQGRGVRVFLYFIVGASSIAPLAGGYLIAAFSWKALFICTSLIALVSAFLIMSAVPHVGHKEPQERGDTHVWPYIIFSLAQASLQIVMQQVRFELFSATPCLVLLTIAGGMLLSWFIWQQWHHPKPLVRLHALREKAFQAGIVLYVFFYSINTALSYLTSRLLENGLNYPVENAGRLIGLTSMVSLIAVYLYFRYSPHIKRKKLLIIPGFLMAIAIAAWLAKMAPDASMSWLVVPMALRGILLVFIALPVAGVTFSMISTDEFTHGYRFKNIVKQLTISFSTASIITLEQHRNALHYTRLAEDINSSTPAWNQMIALLQTEWGISRELATNFATNETIRQAIQQANFLSLLDGFWTVAGLALAGLMFGLWQKQIR